jgi:hypothetical protein
MFNYSVWAFFHLLWQLQHSTQLAATVDSQGVIHYGGSAIQAFIYALQTGWHFMWL